MGFKEEFGFEAAESVPDARSSRQETVLDRYEEAVREFKESGERCVKKALDCDNPGLEVARWRNAAGNVGGVTVSKRGDRMYLSLGDPERKRSSWPL